MRSIESTFRVTLRAIAAYSSDDHARDLALAALAEDSPRLAPLSSPRLPSSRSTMTDQDRRDYERDRKRRQRGTVPSVPEDVPMSPDVPGDRDGDMSPSLSRSPSPLSSVDLTSSAPREEIAHPVVPGTAPVVPVSPGQTRGDMNATADGAMGMLVSSWADGIRSVTGETFPQPAWKAAGQLAATLRAKCLGIDPCADARKLGAEYATAKKGGQLSAAWFCEWLGSGKPKPGAASGPRVARTPGVTLQPAWSPKKTEGATT